jgi:hypothetical protein
VTNVEGFLRNPCVSVDIDDPSDITQVVTAVIRNNLIQLFAEKSVLCHT